MKGGGGEAGRERGIPIVRSLHIPSHTRPTSAGRGPRPFRFRDRRAKTIWKGGKEGGSASVRSHGESGQKQVRRKDEGQGKVSLSLVSEGWDGVSLKRGREGRGTVSERLLASSGERKGPRIYQSMRKRSGGVQGSRGRRGRRQENGGERRGEEGKFQHRTWVIARGSTSLAHGPR